MGALSCTAGVGPLTRAQRAWAALPDSPRPVLLPTQDLVSPAAPQGRRLKGRLEGPRRNRIHRVNRHASLSGKALHAHRRSLLPPVLR